MASHTRIIACLLSCFFSILSLHTISAPQCQAALTADQLIILINDSDPDSVRLGRFYAQRRGIPPTHIIALDLPYRESISRQEYEEDLVQPLRKALVERNLAGQARAIATIYGVPLKIESPTATDQETRWKKDALEWQQATMTFVRTLRTQLADLLEPKSHENLSYDPQTENVSPANHSDLNQLIQATRNIMTSVQVQMAQQVDSTALKQKKEAYSKIEKQLLGLRVHSPSFNGSSLSTLETQTASQKSLPGQIEVATTLLTLLSQTPSDKNREFAYQLAQQYFGLFGVLSLTVNESKQFTFIDADASLDSELSLLWYEPGEYHLSERSPNPLYAWTSAKPSNDRNPAGSEFPLLMISRIDAPTPSLAKQMIDYAILAEQTGITGNAYIDARGLNNDNELGYGGYDESLRALARLLKHRSAHPVILDNTERRFSQPGEAPSAGIYAGWYRYRHYEDAFTFTPGAIGYHIASGEAINIHNPNEAGWCKNALERGITITLGPTSEPYVDAFPKPSEFFGLLLTGQYSMVEAYYLSIRYVSWRMALFGDPLYNPWKGRPLVTLGDLQKDLSIFSGFSQLPLPPSARHIPDPVQALLRRTQEREKFIRQIPAFLSRQP